MDITVILPYNPRDKIACALQYKCFSEFFTNVQVVTCDKTLITHENLCTADSSNSILYIYSPYILPFKPPPTYNVKQSLIDDSVRLVHYHCPGSTYITSVPHLCTEFAPTMHFRENTHFVYFSPDQILTIQNMQIFARQHLQVKADRQLWEEARFLWYHHAQVIIVTIFSIYIFYRLCRSIKKSIRK